MSPSRHARTMPRRHRRAFTAIELMIAIGIMAGAAGMAIPLYRDYQAQLDVDTATEHLVQALRAAQTSARGGVSDAPWGVYFPAGTLFAGDSYATRSTDADLTFPIPGSIETSGLDNVVYAPVSGTPSPTGTVYVVSKNTGRYRSITINPNGTLDVSGIQQGESAGTGTTGGTSTGGGGDDMNCQEPESCPSAAEGCYIAGRIVRGSCVLDCGTQVCDGDSSGGDSGGSTTGGTTGGSTTGGTTGGSSGGGDGVTSCVKKTSLEGAACTLAGNTFTEANWTCADCIVINEAGGICRTPSEWNTRGQTACADHCTAQVCEGEGTTGGGGGSASSSGGGSDSSSSSSSEDDTQCGLLSFEVQGSGCAITGEYPGAAYACFDGAERTVESDTAACKTTADWLEEANNFCAGHCSGNQSCETRFRIHNEEGAVVRSLGTNDVRFRVLGARGTYGSSTNRINIRGSLSLDEGQRWTDLSGGKIFEGNEQDTFDNVPAGTPLLLRFNGRYSWIFNKTYRTDGNDGHVVALQNGDPLPDALAALPFTSLPSFLRSVVTQEGSVRLSDKEVLYLVEMGALDGSEDYLDLALVATFTGRNKACTDPTRARVKVSFRRIANTGEGSVTPTVSVGSDATRFAEEQWIPLVDSTGHMIIDDGIVEDVTGLAMQRGNGWIRLLHHGTLPAGSKEIVDARVLLSKAYIQLVENEAAPDASEAPTDGIVNDTDGNDEFVDGPNAKSMIWKTRVESTDDGVILHWLPGEPGSGGESSSSSSSSDDSSDGDGDLCYVPYSVDSRGSIVLNDLADVTISVVGSQASHTDGGPRMGIRSRVSLDGGITWSSLFGGRSLRGGETVTLRDVAPGSTIVVEFNGRYSWIFNRTIESGRGDRRVRVLKRLQTFDGLVGVLARGQLRRYLRNLLTSDARMNIGVREIAILAQVGDSRTPNYHDAVLLLSVDKPASSGGCDGGGGGSSSSSSSESSSSSSGLDPLLDADEDGIVNGDDWCPLSTTLPEDVPNEYMSFDRYALTTNRGNPHQIPVFRTGPRRARSEYTLAATHGCSCSQILDAIEDLGFHRFDEHPILYRKMQNLFGFVVSNARKFGCSQSLMRMIAEHDED